MGTVVVDKVYPNSSGSYSTIVSDLRALWNWTSSAETSAGTKLTIDAAKKIGLFVYNGNVNYTTIGVIFGSSYYHLAGPQSTVGKLQLKAEKVGDNTLIISAWRVDASGSSNVAADLCDKYIICRAVNTNTENEETILIYLGSSSSSGDNKCAMFTSDVIQQINISAQDANQNVNAKNTNIVPFFNPASAFVTKDVYQSLCENVSSWYFGDVTINGRPYRMSGSVFVLDE